jgi:hypothetical protein
MFNWSDLGVFIVIVVCCFGALAGLLVSLSARWILRWRAARPFYDALAGMVGLLIGSAIGIRSSLYSIRVNGKVVGWSEGHSWLGLRPWVFEHELAVSIGTFLISVLLSILIRSIWFPRDGPRPHENSEAEGGTPVSA